MRNLLLLSELRRVCKSHVIKEAGEKSDGFPNSEGFPSLRKGEEEDRVGNADIKGRIDEGYVGKQKRSGNGENDH